MEKNIVIGEIGQHILPDGLILPPGRTPEVRPFGQYIWMAEGSCDQGCAHCYVYESLLDLKRRARSPMKSKVALRLGETIGEHMLSNNMQFAHAVGHGGEPLREPDNFLEQVANIREGARSVHPDGTILFRVHTNGNAFSRPKYKDEDPTRNILMDTFRENDIMVGISLDGTPEEHNEARPMLNGKPSYEFTEYAAHMLSTHYTDIYGRLLCTINLQNQKDPLRTLDACMQFLPNAGQLHMLGGRRDAITLENGRRVESRFKLGFLLPHATPEQLPFRPEENGETAYADWLIPIFDSLITDRRAAQLDVPLFQGIIAAYQDRNKSTKRRIIDHFGGMLGGMVYVENNGDVTLESPYRISGQDTGKLMRNIQDEGFMFDTVVDDLRHIARFAGLIQQCESNECGIRDGCMGGANSHRVTAQGFDKTPYCHDFQKLFGHIYKTLQSFEESRI